MLELGIAIREFVAKFVAKFVDGSADDGFVLEPCDGNGVAMPSNHQILIVGVNARNLDLLGGFLEKQGYRSVSASTPQQLEEAVQSRSDLALALVDVSGFNASIWDQCQKIVERGIRLLVISPKQSMAIQKESLTHGAQGVLVKPLVMHELTELIRGLMEE